MQFHEHRCQLQPGELPMPSMSAIVTRVTAVTHPDGTKAWYRDGKLHREDGPAVEWSTGSKFWYRDGRLHREDGPAIEHADGSRSWYRRGKLYRDNGPVIERADSVKIRP
jgi:hypothetical protein